MLLSYSCAPVFSEMQSAGTVGEGNMDGTVSFSSVRFSDDSETTTIQNHADAQYAYGLFDNLDLRARYSSVWVDDDDIRVNVLGFGPKYNFIKDRLSVYLPIGFAFGEDIETSESFQMHPTLLGTLPIVNRIEVNPSFKLLLPLSGNGDTTAAFNLGLGLDIVDGITIRPEYGILFNPGDEGYYGHFGIGLTFNPSRRNSVSETK